MKPLLIFRHLSCEGPGYFSDVLTRHSIPFHIIAVDQGDCVPTTVDETSGLIFMGGPMSVNDDLPWIDRELALIRQARERQLPVLGHCLGAQLIAKAFGGVVAPNRVKEIGWHEVRTTTSPEAQDWLSGIPHRFEAFHWHGETFTLPDGATPLLSSQWCENQAFALDNMLAVQCHVEMTSDMVREWSEVHNHELTHPSASVLSATQMLEGLDDRIAALQRVADRLYDRWLAPLIA